MEKEKQRAVEIMNNLKTLVIFDQCENERGEEVIDIREKRFAYEAVV